MLFKTCVGCRRHLPISEYSTLGNKRSGWRPRCKACHAAEERERYRTQPEVREKMKANARRRHERLMAETDPRKRAAKRGTDREKSKRHYKKKGERPPYSWKTSDRLDALERAHFWENQGARYTRARRVYDVDRDGIPPAGIYGEMVAVSQEGTIGVRTSSTRVSWYSSWETVPWPYRKFVFGCRAGHTQEELGDEPGGCLECKAEKAGVILPASVRLSR